MTDANRDYKAATGCDAMIRAKPPTSHRRKHYNYVCSACRMAFEDLTGFNRHRHQGLCLSPAELQAQNCQMIIRNGIWVKVGSSE